jgi:hypothetical protein
MKGMVFSPDIMGVSLTATQIDIAATEYYTNKQISAQYGGGDTLDMVLFLRVFNVSFPVENRWGFVTSELIVP